MRYNVLKYIANFLNNINLTFAGTEAYNQEWLLLPFETITGIPIRGEKYWKLCICKLHCMQFFKKKFCIEG